MPNSQASLDWAAKEYEDLLSLWSDLEAALAITLLKPRQVQEFPEKIRHLDAWLQDLVAHDSDAALYLLFQQASTSTVGYSTSHALVCGTLCHILAQELQLPQPERDALVRAALTMNIGMTALQDQLAEQRERPNAAQQEGIKHHPRESQLLLERLYVNDALWLDVVGRHHDPVAGRTPLALLSPADRLVRILSTVDRYAAMISPRRSRAGRSVAESVRTILGQGVNAADDVGAALVRCIGLCPPGTFVQLSNGDTAVVLRRTTNANQPLVATLIDADGAHYREPLLLETAPLQPQIVAPLARSAVALDLNHRTMVRLGLYAARPHLTPPRHS